MSEETIKSDPTDGSPDSQSERWVKYGSNTAIATVVVILLAALVIFVAEKKDRRIDTTAGGLYSLKPQTIKVIEGNRQHITITSFYSKAKPGEATYGTGDEAATAEQAAALEQQADKINDVLAEYAARGHDITVESIDPKLNPDKAATLIEQVTSQYGGQVAKYKAFTDALPKKYEAISTVAAAEATKIKALPLSDITSEELQNSVGLAIVSVRDIPRLMKQNQEGYQRYLRQKPPDYKGITDTVSDNMTALSTVLDRVVADFARYKDDAAVPAQIRQYMAQSAPAYQGMKKQADELIAEVKGLGELKLDTIREALHQENAILVRGEHDWKIIRYDQVWKSDARDIRSASAGGVVHPRFAGEQMITTAILSLGQPTKPKVCFVRAGGEPLAASGGPFASMAGRLRDYNFDVTEKDLTGTYAMQQMQQQQQMPPVPEPTDAEIDDAIWVVFASQAQQQQNPMMGGPPPGIGDKVRDHVLKGHHWADGKLADGGSAFVLAFPHGEALADALTPFGVTIRPDALAIHQLVKTDNASAEAGDIINQVEKNPTIFAVHDWGDSVITNAMAGLPGILLYVVPVETNTVAGATVHPLIPVPGAPDNPPSWGETDFASLEAGPKFDPGDLPAPLSAGALSERANGSRLVVAGSFRAFVGSDTGSVSESIVDFPDPDLLRRGVNVPLFPGNAEFFMNSCFWLSHQEPMIAISPAAMTVSRLGPMSRTGQGFWRIGVLLIGLPGLVLLAGAMAYVSRRD